MNESVTADVPEMKMKVKDLHKKSELDFQSMSPALRKIGKYIILKDVEGWSLPCMGTETHFVDLQ